MDDAKTPKDADEFRCLYCDFKCSKKSDWERHCERPKHTTNVQRYENGDKKTLKNAEPTMKCDCGNIYKHYSGLWRHKNKCNNLCIHEPPPPPPATTTNDELTNLTHLVLEVVKSNNELQKQNQELQKQILEVCKNGIINNTNHVNSHNKTFNLQVFLNEECKDAMNIKDFVESIQIQLADVESVGELGYVNGISKIIIKNLKALDTNKRPVHCTDQKRETIYIKDAGVWVKDDDNSKLRRMIKSVSNRNYKNTRLYKDKHPDCNEADSKYSDTYNKIVVEATGGGSKCNDFESENKIMKKIAKEMVIDKPTCSN
jgi:hypothetical protein